MRIIPMTQQECSELLNRVNIGRLACSLDDQPYIVPVGFSYEPDFIYVFSTLGKKIKWMRQNPKVCLQADEIASLSNWLSVIVTGTYVELREPEYTAQLEHALEQLKQYSECGGETLWRKDANKPAMCRLNPCSFASILSR